MALSAGCAEDGTTVWNRDSAGHLLCALHAGFAQHTHSSCAMLEMLLHQDANMLQGMISQ